MNLLPVYARKNPDGTVSIFRDAEGSNHFATFQAHSRSKPTRRNKYVTLNCYRWALNWIS